MVFYIPQMWYSSDRGNTVNVAWPINLFVANLASVFCTKNIGSKLIG